MSEREPGSVASSSSRSPEDASFNALARETSGPGQDWPLASTMVERYCKVMERSWTQVHLRCGWWDEERSGGARGGEGRPWSAGTADAVGDHGPHDAGFARADHLQVQQCRPRGCSGQTNDRSPHRGRLATQAGARDQDRSSRAGGLGAPSRSRSVSSLVSTLSPFRVERLGGIVVLDDAASDLGRGSDYTGPNGVGKSTLLRIRRASRCRTRGGSNASRIPHRGAARSGAGRGRGERGTFARGARASTPWPSLSRPPSAAMSDDLASTRRMAEALERFDRLGGHDFESRASATAAELGLPDLQTPMDTLSGGQRTRAALAAIELARVNVLLLDEPTTTSTPRRLAARSVRRGVPGGIVVVSHDRAFLVPACTASWVGCLHAPGQRVHRHVERVRGRTRATTQTAAHRPRRRGGGTCSASAACP